MGNSTPKGHTTKLMHSGRNQTLEYVCAQMRGWRKSMQDSSIYELQIPTPQNGSNYKNSLFAVFDGHGTSYISRFLSENFVSVLVSRQDYQKGHYTQALEETFKVLDEMMLSKQGQQKLKKIKQQEDEICESGKYHPIGERIGDFCGSTANVVLITQKFYFVANCGDSRSVLYRSGFCIDLSKDHKPDQPQEIKRIRRANGYVNHGRINDVLSVSRSFGDYELKQSKHLSWADQVLTCKPDIQSFAKSSRDEFIMIGCDGIWQNSQQSKEIIELFVRLKSYKKGDYSTAVEEFLNELVAKDQQQEFGQDNMTAILVKMGEIKSEKVIPEKQNTEPIQQKQNGTKQE